MSVRPESARDNRSRSAMERLSSDLEVRSDGSDWYKDRDAFVSDEDFFFFFLPVLIPDSIL